MDSKSRPFGFDYLGLTVIRVRDVGENLDEKKGRNQSNSSNASDKERQDVVREERR